MRAKARLHDQRVLILTEDVGATKVGIEKAGIVELMKLPETERLAS